MSFNQVAFLIKCRRAQLQCGHIFGWFGGACESVGAKESTLVMNENGPFMLHGCPTFCPPIHNQRQIPVGRDTDTVFSLLSVGFVHSHL